MDNYDIREIERTAKSLRICEDWKTDCEGCCYEGSIPRCREKMMLYAADMLETLLEKLKERSINEQNMQEGSGAEGDQRKTAAR